MSGRLGLTGWPAVAEEAVIARDCLLTAHVGSALHVCHVSTAGSVEIIRWAKCKGWRVTAEVTPHHLLLTDSLAAGYDPVYKVNPPLRTAADVAALREGLADGTIDCVATDHAPHPVEDKETEWDTARVRHDRPGNRAARGAGGHGRHRACSTGPGWPTGWPGARPASAGCPARSRALAAGLAGQPDALRRRRPATRWTRARTPPGAGTARSGGWNCRAGWWPRSCAGRPPSSTGSSPDGRVADGGVAGERRRRRDPGPGGRHHVPRDRVRRGRRDLRRDGLQHRHDRLPGDADRPVVLPARSWP